MTRLLLTILALMVMDVAPARGQLDGKDLGADTESPIPITPRSHDSKLNDRSHNLTGYVLGALILGVVGLVPFIRRYLSSGSVQIRSRAIQVLERCPLESNSTIYLVRCGPRVLVIGSSNTQLSTLSEIAEPDEVDELLARCGVGYSPASSQQTSGEHLESRRPFREQLDNIREKIHAENSNV